MRCLRRGLDRFWKSKIPVPPVSLPSFVCRKKSQKWCSPDDTIWPIKLDSIGRLHSRSLSVSKGNGPLNQSTGLLSVPMDRERGRGLGWSSCLFFSSLSTSCTSYMLIPRHTGHFLKCLWALPDTKHRKGGSLFILHVLHFYTCGIFRN